MKEIELTQGKVALVDDDVYEWASKFKWFAQKRRNGRFYAARNASQKHGGKRGTILLHREIMKPGLGEQVDHKFGNTLDNRRSEMRNVTNAQNGQAHRKKSTGKTSKFRGVSWRSDRGKWRSCLEKDRIFRHLGYFESEADAARAYDKAALELFGEFAQLNHRV